ncbi:radical SAM domain protein [Minicystis rosea]|nr:radical SAM domain protein [Minicystis rosea]
MESKGEPKSQVEIQLGHMCNNRCVFCVSGQETALGRALPLDTAPILAEITRARESGHAKITLLGGEPTLQPGFLDVVRHAVALGFEEIVLFTNGVKTARAAFIDEILATGGKFTWRISLQGATKEAHERTTKKDGSFDRIARTMETLRARGERLTVNMCVVSSNYESVNAFPALLLPVGATQLHLDMVRPLDAGARSEEELRAMIPRYSDMVPALEAMVKGFPEGFDVNIGNLPYCIAPHLARVIHHDGERTLTIAVDGDNKLSRPWDKYLVKRRDKVKPESCRACVFESRCSGVFEAYRHFYGTDELVPITPERLRAVDPDRRFLALHLRPMLARLGTLSLPAPFSHLTVTETGDTEVTLVLTGAKPSDGQRLAVALRPPRAGAASFDSFSMQVLDRQGDPLAALAALRALWSAFAEGHHRVLHPMGDDATMPVSRTIGARLMRLRERAPFGELVWRDVIVSEGGRRAEAMFEGPAGERTTVWLTEQGGKPAGGYRVDSGEATPALVEGLRAIMAALRPKVETVATM